MPRLFHNFHHAINTRRLMFNPIAGVKRANVVRKNKEVFAIDELRTLLHPERESDPYFLRFALLAYTGCRIGEAMHLRWSDIRWEAKVIEICHQPGVYKLKREKERFLPLQDELADILRRHAKLAGFIIANPEERDCEGKRHLFAGGVLSRRPVSGRIAILSFSDFRLEGSSQQKIGDD